MKIWKFLTQNSRRFEFGRWVNATIFWSYFCILRLASTYRFWWNHLKDFKCGWIIPNVDVKKGKHSQFVSISISIRGIYPQVLSCQNHAQDHTKMGMVFFFFLTLEAVSEWVTERVLCEDKTHGTGRTMSDPDILVLTAIALQSSSRLKPNHTKVWRNWT